MRPEQMMIIAPNPLFLDYISGVLPDLGVDRVVQTTFGQLIASLLGKRLPRVDSRDRLGEMLSMDAAGRECLTRRTARKGFAPDICGAGKIHGRLRTRICAP